MDPIVGAVLSYLIGSISFPGTYAKLKGIDLQARGEGHLGATSIYTATKSSGLFIVLGILDGLKGVITYYFFGVYGLLFALLGHMFPLFFGFRGGNGVSVYYGGALVSVPAVVFLSLLLELVVWKFVKKWWRHLLYLLIRVIPALFYNQLLPAYILLLLKHIWFYYSRFRKDNPVSLDENP